MSTCSVRYSLVQDSMQGKGQMYNVRIFTSDTMKFRIRKSATGSGTLYADEY